MSVKNRSYYIVAGIILLLVIAWYFQSQGFIKIFPTSEDVKISRALRIDESKFVAAEGLSAADFQKKIDEAKALRDEVKNNPENANNWFRFGNSLSFLNDHEGAVVAWKMAFELQPLNFVVTANLGNTYQYFLKDWPMAEFYYLKAIEVKADFTTAYSGLVDLYRYNYAEKFGELEPLLLRAVKDDSANASGYYSILVETFVDRGDLSKAKSYLAEVQKLNPESAQSLRASYPQLQ